MSKEACSEDEASAMNNRIHYRKIRPAWRSTAPDVDAWFKAFDHLHMSTRFHKNGKRKPGRIPRHRFPASASQASNTKIYPKGLPRNFYDETWLDTLDDFEKEQLKIRAPIDLIFDDDVHRYVRR